MNVEVVLETLQLLEDQSEKLCRRGSGKGCAEIDQGELRGGGSWSLGDEGGAKGVHALFVSRRDE